MSDLTLHASGPRRAFQSSLADVLAVKTPPSEGNTWVPIPHGSVYDAILQSTERLGLNIVSSEHALTLDGSRYFGIITLERANEPEWGPIMGVPSRLQVAFSNAHDKSMAIRLGFGASVRACDNTVIWASDIVRIIHKRTPVSRLYELVHAKIDEWFNPSRIAEADSSIATLQRTSLTPHMRNSVILDFALKGACSYRDLAAVVHEATRVDGPGGHFPDANRATLFHLLMAVTEVHKQTTPATLLAKRAQKAVRVLLSYC